MDALDFLEKIEKLPGQSTYALHGDEDFLRKLVTDTLLARLVGDDDPTLSVSVYSPGEIDWAGVRSELEMVSFFGSRRIVVLDQADTFVTAHRTSLEKYVAKPTGKGVLILQVKTFPKTTKLAKSMPADAVIECKTPSLKALPGWCVDWAKQRHAKALEPGAAQALVSIIGDSMGQLDQELAKLTVAVGSAKAIRLHDVERLTARHPAAEVFRILDDVCHGRLAAGLQALHQLLEVGEEPIKILSGPLSSQLRTLARVGRLCKQGLSLQSAMEEAGIRVNWQAARQSAEQQIRHLGPARLEQLYEWLLETDRALKSTTGVPASLHLERLLVRLA